VFDLNKCFVKTIIENTFQKIISYSGRLGVWLRVRFTRSHTWQRLVKEKKCVFLVGPTKIRDWTASFEKQHFAASRGGKGTSTMEPCSIAHCSLSEQFYFYFLKNQHAKYFFSEKLVQLINCTRIVHVNVNVNNIFFCF